MTAKRSRNYHDQHRWKKKLLLSFISFRISCHPRKRTRKVERGKKLLDTQTEEDPSNLRHKQSSRVRSSLSRESKKVKKKKKKKKEERKKIKKQKRVSRNDKIRNSFRQRRQWN